MLELEAKGGGSGRDDDVGSDLGLGARRAAASVRTGRDPGGSWSGERGTAWVPQGCRAALSRHIFLHLSIGRVRATLRICGF